MKLENEKVTGTDKVCSEPTKYCEEEMHKEIYKLILRI